MKAKRFFLILLAAGMTLTGCGNRVVVSGQQAIKLDYDVYSNQWERLDDCYRATLDVQGITRTVVNHGKVDVTRRYPGENYGVDVWTPLPCMRTEVENVNGADVYYTTFVDYEWTERTVNIYVTTSDLYTGNVPPTMYFRVYVTK